jgi:hypothetical protein
MHPSVFFLFYANFIPNYYLQPQRLNNLLVASNVLNQKILAQIEIEKENERKRQEFLNSPEGKRQIAAERERQRAYERLSYGEKRNLPAPFRTINSEGEYAAACVATTFAFNETARGTNYDTREARSWGGKAIISYNQMPDPNFKPRMENWFNQLRRISASTNLILFERCKRDFPVPENIGAYR